jgi:hypothetical protein
MRKGEWRIPTVFEKIEPRKFAIISLGLNEEKIVVSPGLESGNQSLSYSCFERLSNHMGTEKRPTVGSSGESWSMNESLNRRFT